MLRFLGGALLPRDDQLTLAECPIRSNTYVEVVGRLLGGVEVTIFGRQHKIDDAGGLNFRNMRIGPAEIKEVATFLMTPASAALNSVTIDGNPIGYPSGASVKPGAETGVAVKKGAFAAVDGRFGEVVYLNGSSSKIRWLDDGSMSAYIKNDKLTSVVASRTDLIEDYSHIRSLGEALSGSKVHTYGLANCNFTPATLTTFVESVRWAHAALNSLKCANNPGMVGELEYGELKTPDAHAEVFKQLTDNLKTSQVTEADFSSCGLGPVALGHLSEWVRDAEAALNSVTVDGNPIGYPSATLKPGAVTGIEVKKGVFAAVDGRFGEVTQDPDRDSEVKLRWLDDGSEGQFGRRPYIKTDKLTSVVASRTDLIEDYSHIRSLGEALSGSKVQTYGFANCNFNPVSLATFVESVRWADAGGQRGSELPQG